MRYLFLPFFLVVFTNAFSQPGTENKYLRGDSLNKKKFDTLIHSLLEKYSSDTTELKSMDDIKKMIKAYNTVLVYHFKDKSGDYFRFQKIFQSLLPQIIVAIDGKYTIGLGIYSEKIDMVIGGNLEDKASRFYLLDVERYNKHSLE
jgi:hypothetical protein